jgi:hypothetical protein
MGQITGGEVARVAISDTEVAPSTHGRAKTIEGRSPVPGRPQLSPLEAFELNMGDAYWLLRTAEVLANQRVNRMRRELRERVGEALGIAAGRRDELDCIESEDTFIVIKPGASITRDHVQDLSPLLRQAIVAACAALETYVADAVMARIGPVARSNDMPRRLAGLQLDLRTWDYIERNYVYRRRGLRERVIGPRVRELSSTSPGQIGVLMSMMGIDGWTKRIDGIRDAVKGTTEEQLEALTQRRNRIAHAGDRQGRGRATIATDEVGAYLVMVEDVVHAIEHVLGSVPTGDD